MDSKKELRIAFIMAGILFVVGVFSYAAFSAKAPEGDPIRMMFYTSAGKVLFQHELHTAPSGYGVSCYDCHHHPEEDESAIRACRDCHGSEEGISETALETCMECHDEDEIEDAEMVKRSDAAHTQCGDCHKAIESGPVKEECSGCHVM